MTFVEDLDPDDPGVRRINYAFVPDDDPELLAHIERLAERRNERESARRSRTTVPSFRKPPRTRALRTLPPKTFPAPPSSPHRIHLENIGVHPTGLVFDVVSQAGDGMYLGIVLDDGTVVSNRTSSLYYAPEDGDRRTPWLHRGKTHNARTRYFLSPLPAIDLEITISYPEIGIDRAMTVAVHNSIDVTRS
ncbi:MULTISPECIES: hypothetical protein [Nocardiaceae]|uniref:hypothetical protein n=1 Tax=Nocardiaceae TaxID=85025 RepID=UPI0005616EF6|nr:MULTISPECIES: hypothetical protein [Rhodococcus]OZF03229.1 hypothetical protein CH301_07270 [Rhodococcus sp. 15-1189-1-1a]OZF17032.1 hypothetical protein CH299_07820 [Rhodococcus sp. 14-2686-1-2]OZF54566.1 hypothetical protein CH293_07600 [Rhodococcus sp. 14-2470-1b]